MVLNLLALYLFLTKCAGMQYDANNPQGSSERCTKFDSYHYMTNPTVEEEAKSCGNGLIEYAHSDIMYQFRGNVYYAKRVSNEYRIYNFTDSTLLFFGVPPVQSSTKLWSFCPNSADVATFATSYNDTDLFIYFKKPANTMIKVVLGYHAKWDKVNESVHRNCTDKANDVAGPCNASLRQLYSALEPRTAVLLLGGDTLIRCEWKEGTLRFVSMTKSIFGMCPVGSSYFIDRFGVSYHLTRDPDRTRYQCSGIVTSLRRAIGYKPPLAAIFTNYTNLNRKSLIKFIMSGSADCAQDSVRGRLYRVYEWESFEAFTILMRENSLNQTWLRVQIDKVRSIKFCEVNARGKCCSKFVKDILTSRRYTLYPSATHAKCRVYLLLANETLLCPELRCIFGEDRSPPSGKKENVACEIPLVGEPSTLSAFEEWLSTSDDVAYVDASEAVLRFEDLARLTTIRTSNSSRILHKLLDAVEALEVVNYTNVSGRRLKDFMGDMTVVVDRLIDERHSSVWADQGGSRQNHLRNAGELPKNNKAPKNASFLSPLDALLAFDRVIESILVSRNGVEDSNFSYEVRTGNIKSKIGNIAKYAGYMNVIFETNESEYDGKAFYAISLYPNILRGKPIFSDEFCDNNANPKRSSQCNYQYLETSPILSASIISRNGKSPVAVRFSIHFNTSDIPTPNQTTPKFYFSCNYLVHGEPGRSTWDSKGCEVAMVDRVRNYVHCSCKHTTNFAILLQPVPPKIRKEDVRYLTLISYIGEGVSLVCLVLSLIAFVALRSRLKSSRIDAHTHLVISLIVFHVTQIFTVFAEKNKNSDAVPCIAVAFLTHFSLLSAFCWMLVEGMTLYMSIVHVFQNDSRAKYFRYLVGWVVPGIISGISLAYGITRQPYPTCYLEGVGEMSCRNKDDPQNIDSLPEIQVIEWCWLSSSSGLIWAMIIPAACVLFVNSAILVKVTVIIAKTTKDDNMFRPTTEQRKEKHIKKCLKGVTILMPILGLPWLLGLIPQSATHTTLLYIFTILNSTQGFFIFLFCCVLSGEVRSAAAGYFRQQHWFSGGTSTYSSSNSFLPTSSRSRVASGSFKGSK